MLVDPQMLERHDPLIGATTRVSVRIVSPEKTGRGKVVSVIPRLAMVVPMVVSCTDSPITSPSVKIEFISGLPNSVVAQ
eukprot:gene10186-10254_t